MSLELDPQIAHAALFDRTPEQRQRHTDIVVGMHREYPKLDHDMVSVLADLQMENEFYEWLDKTATERSSLYRVEDTQPFLGEYIVSKEVAMNVLTRELGELHEALGFPMLELKRSNKWLD